MRVVQLINRSEDSQETNQGTKVSIWATSENALCFRIIVQPELDLTVNVVTDVMKHILFEHL